MKQFALVVLIIALPLGWLFRAQIFNHNLIGFSNDGPLGTQVAQQAALPEGVTGIWADLNYLGKRDPSLNNMSAGLRMLCENAAVFAVVILMPVVFIACRWGLCWAVFWVNAAQVVFIIGFGVGMACGWIDPYKTWCWMIMPIGQLLFIPSTIIVLVQDGLNEDPARRVLPEFSTWKDIKEMPGWCWAFLIYLCSIDGVPYLMKQLK